ALRSTAPPTGVGSLAVASPAQLIDPRRFALPAGTWTSPTQQTKDWPGLAATLAGFDDDRLVRLLAARPDLATPAPRDWAAFASRAGGWPSARDAYREVDRGAQRVAEALCLLPQPARLAEVAGLLGVAGDDPDL